MNSVLLPAAAGQTAQEKDVDKTSRMKQQIEEELKQLEEDIAACKGPKSAHAHTHTQVQNHIIYIINS